ncbi:3-oxoacyl-[acyl-carrier protein] reductase [Aureibacillus halotolerans]|uniref:3-oxoacyl-[acyl-carrier protein] reductase n=2 Tax=Aureibacillus halotolerans TaxID=1508390 RepID=A0A4R6U8L5_9BACI|nr:3-oxoacyl-[acyl-carrier protein] reductase [Aureibacillus halotolerans]
MKNQHALVMASSSGLGKAIAMTLAEEGAHVFLTSRDQERLSAAVAEVRTVAQGKVSSIVCDVTKPEDIEAAVQAVIDQYGTIDILVNNAGGPPPGHFIDMDDTQWQQAFDLNLMSFIRTMKACLPHMTANRYGRIVTIASSSVKQPIDGLILSNTFRTAVMGLSKSLASEYGEYNILINTLGPGRIETDRLKSLEHAMADKQAVSVDDIQQLHKATIPVGRYGQPEEFAATAAFLCSARNSYVTGQTFLVDGGMVKAL